jgi:hypothetical protein
MHTNIKNKNKKITSTAELEKALLLSYSNTLSSSSEVEGATHTIINRMMSLALMSVENRIELGKEYDFLELALERLESPINIVKNEKKIKIMELKVLSDLKKASGSSEDNIMPSILINMRKQKK